MNRLIVALLVVAVCLFFTAIGSAEPPLSGAKTAIASARLLLPLYVVDTINPGGATTLFAVRNQSSSEITIEIRYFRTDRPQAPQRTDVVSLAGKAVKTVNIAHVTGLHIDGAGMARGYVIIQTLEPAARIQGDYFLVTPNQDYATGFRLVNIDRTSTHDELCSVFTVRFLNGGGFDSATRYLIWRDLDEPLIPGETAFAFAVYDEAGVLQIASEFASDQTAFEVTAYDLLHPMVSIDFGAIEIQFSHGELGHISAVMSASGRYSVGLEASCGDF